MSFSCYIRFAPPVLSNFWSSSMLKIMNTIMTSESPEPRYQFEFTVNSCSMMLPMRFILPPPSMFEITNVVSAGMNTMVGYVYDMLYGDSGGYPSYASAAAIILFVIVLTITVINLLVSRRHVHYT